ncbi:MAG: hypothetical protein HY646_13770 [Acidobacteria bacterium]|nr:hypothetical protein [Acidobacteriota bacterium]
MIAPVVHLNGTSKEALLDGYVEAGRAVQKALDALAERAFPNPRDYYVIGPDAWSKARDEHNERVRLLVKVQLELEQLAEKIADQ